MYCCINSGGVTVFLTEIQKCSLSSFHQKITLLCNLKQLTIIISDYFIHRRQPLHHHCHQYDHHHWISLTLSLWEITNYCLFWVCLSIFFSNIFSDPQRKKTLFTFHLYIKLPNATISLSLSFFSLTFFLSLILNVFVSQNVWKLQLYLIY